MTNEAIAQALAPYVGKVCEVLNTNNKLPGNYPKLLEWSDIQRFAFFGLAHRLDRRIKWDTLRVILRRVSGMSPDEVRTLAVHLTKIQGFGRNDVHVNRDAADVSWVVTGVPGSVVIFDDFHLCRVLLDADYNAVEPIPVAGIDYLRSIGVDCPSLHTAGKLLSEVGLAMYQSYGVLTQRY